MSDKVFKLAFEASTEFLRASTSNPLPSVASVVELVFFL